MTQRPEARIPHLDRLGRNLRHLVVPVDTPRPQGWPPRKMTASKIRMAMANSNAKPKAIGGGILPCPLLRLFLLQLLGQITIHLCLFLKGEQMSFPQARLSGVKLLLGFCVKVWTDRRNLLM